MGQLGSGSGTSYPGTLDTAGTEIDAPAVDKTMARADVPNDLYAAVVAIETELGTDPAGSVANVKTFLQAEHNTDGTHGDVTANSVDITTTLDVTGTSTLDLVSLTENATLENTKYIRGKDSGGTAANLIGINGSDKLVLGASTEPIVVNSLLDGTGWPIFSASLTSSQNITTTNSTKVEFNDDDTAGVEFDTNSNYDSTTNYRFLPTVEGYYLLNFNIKLYGITAGENYHVYLDRNGSHLRNYDVVSYNVTTFEGSFSEIVYSDGSTHYWEISVQSTIDTDYNVAGGSAKSRFSGTRIG